MKKKVIIIGCIIFILIILCLFCAIGIRAIIEWKHDRDWIDTPPITNPTDTSDNSTGPDMSSENTNVSSIKIDSIFNENIKSPDPEQVNINEISLALDTLQLLKDTNWDGNKSTKLPISVSAYDQSKLKFYISNQKSKKDLLTIPKDLESVFISTESKAEIRNLMTSGRTEYLAYLKAKGVQDKYVDEISTNTLTDEQSRMEYVGVNDPNAAPTSAGGYIVVNGVNDYSKTSVVVYAVDVYNVADLVCKSRILGELPTEQSAKIAYWKKCRDIAVRELTYHEMTHVLQRAYVTQHVSAAHKTDKSAYVYADKTLVDVDNQYFWKWGGKDIIAASNNRQVSQESQSEGISFEILTNVYNMSKSQKEALWAHLFGRLNTGKSNLNQIKTITESKYPNIAVDEIGTPVATVMKEYNKDGEDTLVSLTNKFAGFPAYIGYLNPMEPDDTGKFWNYLKS